MEFVIGDFIFKSKKAAMEAYALIAQTGKVGWPIEDETAIKMLQALLDAHPWRKNMTRSGVQQFEVMLNPEFHNKSIGIRRMDGTIVSLAVGRFFKTANPTSHELFRARCRRMIADQILEYKRKYFGRSDTAVCELTGEVILWNTCHVDHIRPFECLVRDWEQMTNFDYTNESVENFADYHQDHAQLRCISKAANLSRTDEGCE